MNNKYNCKDCDKDCFIENKDYYMITKELWKQYGVGKGLLCLNCIEKRLGRKLIKEDIFDCCLTRENEYTNQLLTN